MSLTCGMWQAASGKLILMIMLRHQKKHLPHIKLIRKENIFNVYQYANIIIYLPLAAWQTNTKLFYCCLNTIIINLPHSACHLPHVKLHIFFLFRISISQHHKTLAACRHPHAACQTHTFEIFYFYVS